MNIPAQSPLNPSLLEKDEKPHLFRLSNEILDSFDMEDVRSTYNDLVALDLDKDPYRFYAIQVNVKFLYYFSKRVGFIIGEDDGKDDYIMQSVCTFIYELDEDGEHYHFDVFLSAKGHEINLMAAARAGKNKEQENFVNQSAEHLRYFLMVILVTKNIEKVTKRNSSRAISPKQRKDSAKYDYTTTIKIGAITETFTASPGGGARNVRPHLRRGHIRTQHFGKGNAETKKIFIQPVFVNADEGWINEQKKYRVVV